MVLARGIAALLAGLIAALFGVAAPAAAMTSESKVAVYTYDGLAHTAPANDATTERDPPTQYDPGNTYAAVDRWLQGESAHPGDAATTHTANYTYPGTPTQVVEVTTTAGSPLGATDGASLSIQRPVSAAKSVDEVAQVGDTVLYQKLGSAGEHLKYGITKNPATRYTSKELDGGSLNILARGPKQDMLALERSLHETLPIGPQEGQLFYIQKQIANGLRPPPYPW